MMEIKEEDYLMLSGIQHFVFCQRQWALIHIEQQWAENEHTTAGELLHKNAHDPYFNEKRKDIIISRAMPVVSRSMGVSGECDIVEFRKVPDGISLHGHRGLYQVYPVEYKKGSPKAGNADILQLTAQALCLKDCFCQMHQLYDKRYTPKVKWSKSCNACSLKDICLPKLGKTPNVKEYIHTAITEDCQ